MCVALLIQHAVCMCPVVLSLVAGLVYLVFPQYLINGTISGKIILNMKCVLPFCLQFCLKMSNFKKYLVRYHKCEFLMSSTHYSSQI